MKRIIAAVICVFLLLPALCAAADTSPDGAALSSPLTVPAAGDIDGDGNVDSDDAVYLLRHVLFPASFSIGVFADLDGDGRVTSDDAVYLLKHVLFPETYALTKRAFVSGTFIQPGLLSSLSVKKLQKHCDNLLEAGIDTIILQWSVTDKDGVVTGAYYPCELNENRKFNSVIIDKLLEACASRDVKVIMGLNSPEDWFSVVLEDPEWYKREAALGVRVAREIYDKYKSANPDTLCAWYFVPEYYSGMAHNDRAADFLNLYIDGLNAIDPSMPLCFSPFLKSSVTPANTEKQWKEIFSLTHFREGDVFMPQDSVGAGGIQLSSLDDYFAALKRAADTCPELEFWANNECFTTTYKAASFARVAMQVETTAKYVERNVTFAYSHYVSPDITGSTALHNEYVRYYLTGEYDRPEVNERENYAGSKTLVSQGKPYSGAVNTRDDLWDDDGKKLTNGVLATCDGNTAEYFGAESNGAEIIIDLGNVTENLSEFDLYDTFGSWGITSIESVTYYVSEDGSNWTAAGNTVYAYTLNYEDSSDTWLRYDFRCVAKEPLKGRYVKAVIENSGWMWISEFCVYTYDEAE